MSLKAEIEGEKKYSPPRGTTHVGSVNESSGEAGFVPDMERGEVSPGFNCPIIGSIPGAACNLDFGGKFLAFAHSVMVTVKIAIGRGEKREHTLLDELETIS